MTDVEARLVEPMATNLSAENTSPTLKRKASEGTSWLTRAY